MIGKSKKTHILSWVGWMDVILGVIWWPIQSLRYEGVLKHQSYFNFIRSVPADHHISEGAMIAHKTIFCNLFMYENPLSWSVAAACSLFLGFFFQFLL